VTGDRMAHLHDVGRLLWPEPLQLTVGADSGAGGALHQEFLLLPSARRPRLLVPRARRAAVAAVRGYGVGRGRSARVLAAGLTAGLASGIAPLVLRDRVHVVDRSGRGGAASIEAHLSAVLGTDVVVSMYLGAPRANRKPVLQVLTPEGRTLAYVKVGVDPLTCRLVRAEARALTTLADAGLRRTTVADVLHSGQWNGLELLVQSPLPVSESRARPTAEQVGAAQVEVADIGRRDAGPLATSPYWADLTGRIAQLPETSAAATLTDLAGRIEKELGEVPLDLGAWHGDWTPWNTALAGDRLLVWDWERFTVAVPVGYDALHWALQTDLVNHLADPGEAARESLVTAGSVLERFGLSTDQVRATAVGYLAELAARYLADRQAEAGARLGDVGTWLLPAVARALDADD
jgi:hypothetical protein